LGLALLISNWIIPYIITIW